MKKVQNGEAIKTNSFLRNSVEWFVYVGDFITEKFQSKVTTDLMKDQRKEILILNLNT